ncbi:efflux RND transporter periplasmic adaptor subunit [Pyruvatibacter sp.]|uniref:efflux RND transporter periplasmic adaptor subunit n=1 Tax=Pyruvatibacter sp. TaxID=1981328 RepID=UPI0032635F36
MTIKRSYVLATAIAIILAVWILSGQFGTVEGEAGTEETAAATESDVLAEGQDVQTVRARVFESQPVRRDIVIRGRTEPVRAVEVRAETSGSVTKLPVEKGEYVSKGDLLCGLSINARGARLAEAKALREQRWLQYDASQKLAAKGHRSETQAAADKAGYDAAVAQVRQMEVEMSYTRIKAPFDGVLDNRFVEIGDFLSVSQPCATVVDLDPILVVGQVSERDVDKLTMGSVGQARLISGQMLEGVVRFIAKTAEQETRTFRVELAVPNKDNTLPAGITAEIIVAAEAVTAHLMSPAFLVLNDKGAIGVRMVGADKIARFQEVSVLEDSNDGVWVGGLPENATIITVGQEFVRDGQPVEVTMENDGAQS